MNKEFQPSEQSISPGGQLIAKLGKMRNLVEVLESHVDTDGPPPTWVVDRILQAEQLLRLAASYVAFAKEKRFKTEGDAKANKKKRTKP